MQNIIDSISNYMSQPQFCQRNGNLSKAFYYKMRGAGEGPRETIIGSRIYISLEAEADWRWAQENPSKAKQAELAAKAAARQQHTREIATGYWNKKSA